MDTEKTSEAANLVISPAHVLMGAARAELEAAYGRDIVDSGLARATRIPVSKLWQYVHGKVRWTADAWLRCLVTMGFAALTDERLLIALPLPDLAREVLRPYAVGEDECFRRASRASPERPRVVTAEELRADLKKLIPEGLTCGLDGALLARSMGGSDHGGDSADVEPGS